MPIQNSIVIVNYNQASALRRMLSALKLEESTASEIIVVDSGSIDDSADVLKQEFPHIKRLRLKDNRGFSVAANRGIRESAGDVVVVCHSDLIATIHVLAELADRVREGATRRVAAIMPRILDENQHEQPFVGRLPGLGRGLVGIFKPHVARRCFIPHLDHVADHEWAQLACVAISGDIIATIGGFDERFFRYYADADLCQRIHERSYRISIASDLRIIHSGRSPNDEPRASESAIMRKDQQRYFQKHRPRWEQGVLSVDAKIYRWIKKLPAETNA